MRLACFLRTLTVALALAPNSATPQCGPNGCYVTPSPSTRTLAATQGVRSHPTVARIVHQEQSGASIGSGALVALTEDAAYFLTCAHLFEEAGRTRVQLNGQTAPAQILAIDRANDLALLKSEPVAGKAAPTADVAAEGDLLACGYGSSGVLRCVRGPITGQATATGATAPSLRIRGVVRSGDSGGPVFDGRGRVVAVVWGQRGGEVFAMGGAPLRRILARLPRAREQLKPVERTPQTAPADVVRGDDLRELTDRWDQRFDRLREELARLGHERVHAPAASADGSGAPSCSEPTRSEPEAPAVEGFAKHWLSDLGSVLPALAVGGPVGVALWFGRAWWRSRLRTESRARRSDDARPIAVDSPPPPQRVVPETHYVSYQRDDYARAHQWASEQLARKFPGSVELLTSLDSLIRQQLNGKS